MTDKELRKLSRAQLLELLLVQSRELDRLRDELADAKEQLENRELTMERCGSIAEASLALTQIFENAQRAADQYLENVKQRAGQDDAPAADKPLPVQPKPEPVIHQTTAQQPTTAAPAPAERTVQAETPAPVEKTVQAQPVDPAVRSVQPQPAPKPTAPAPAEKPAQTPVQSAAPAAKPAQPQPKPDAPAPAEKPAQTEGSASIEKTAQPEPTTQQAPRPPKPTDLQKPLNPANIQEPQNHHEQKTNDTAKGQAPLNGAAGAGTVPGEKPEEAWKSAPKHRIHPSVSSRRSHSGGNFISACHAYLRKLHGPDSKRGGDRGVSKRK